MKNTFLFLTYWFLINWFTSCQSRQEQSSVAVEQNSSAAEIEIYDFHVTHRCKTCMAIEDNTRQTLDQFYSEQLKNGTISFQVVNIDLPENSAVAEQFQAFGSSLYLRINKENKSEIIDLTDFAFMNAMDEEAFQTKLKQKIETHL